jgi:excinuclease ABC subunit C
MERLEKEMQQAAADLDFERAAELRNRLQAVQRAATKHKVVSTSGDDRDVVALAKAGHDALIQVFIVRDGLLVGREEYFFPAAGDVAGGELMGAFVKQYYERAAFIAPEILLSEELEEKADIEIWLGHRAGRRVRLHRPQRGDKRRLVAMAQENAELALQERQAGRQQAEELRQVALRDLAESLKLPSVPNRIECYDISHLHGASAVASMVVFRAGEPAKEDYRRFRVHVPGPDDYAAMREVIRRRFRRLMATDERDGSFSAWPDLVLVDGGKGQLQAALDALPDLTQPVELAALAKEHEHLFRPGESEPIVLPRDAAALHLLQRIRDEAHRFAVSYHRRLRDEEGRRSLLDEIPGIGPRRRKNLLKHFGSIAGIRAASLEELARVPGMTKRAALAVHAHLGSQEPDRAQS